MGLDDLIPEKDRNTSGRSSSKKSNNTDDDEDDSAYKVIGSPPNDKHFSEERWEKVKRVIREEFGMSVQKVLNNKPAKERYEILHEAALYNSDAEEDSEYRVEERCEICDVAAKNEAGVTINGVRFCIHHPAVQVKNVLDEEEND